MELLMSYKYGETDTGIRYPVLSDTANRYHKKCFDTSTDTAHRLRLCNNNNRSLFRMRTWKKEAMTRWKSLPPYSPCDTIGPFFLAYQNLPGRCLVCKHGSHVIKIPKAEWSSMKNKQQPRPVRFW